MWSARQKRRSAGFSLGVDARGQGQGRAEQSRAGQSKLQECHDRHAQRAEPAPTTCRALQCRAIEDEARRGHAPSSKLRAPSSKLQAQCSLRGAAEAERPSDLIRGGLWCALLDRAVSQDTLQQAAAVRRRRAAGGRAGGMGPTSGRAEKSSGEQESRAEDATDLADVWHRSEQWQKGMSGRREYQRGDTVARIRRNGTRPASLIAIFEGVTLSTAAIAMSCLLIQQRRVQVGCANHQQTPDRSRGTAYLLTQHKRKSPVPLSVGHANQPSPFIRHDHLLRGPAYSAWPFPSCLPGSRSPLRTKFMFPWASRDMEWNSLIVPVEWQFGPTAYIPPTPSLSWETSRCNQRCMELDLAPHGLLDFRVAPYPRAWANKLAPASPEFIWRLRGWCLISSADMIVRLGVVIPPSMVSSPAPAEFRPNAGLSTRTMHRCGTYETFTAAGLAGGTLYCPSRDGLSCAVRDIVGAAISWSSYRGLYTGLIAHAKPPSMPEPRQCSNSGPGYALTRTEDTIAADAVRLNVKSPTYPFAAAIWLFGGEDSRRDLGVLSRLSSWKVDSGCGMNAADAPPSDACTVCDRRLRGHLAKLTEGIAVRHENRMPRLHDRPLSQERWEAAYQAGQAPFLPRSRARPLVASGRLIVLEWRLDSSPPPPPPRQPPSPPPPLPPQIDRLLRQEAVAPLRGSRVPGSCVSLRAFAIFQYHPLPAGCHPSKTGFLQCAEAGSAFILSTRSCDQGAVSRCRLAPGHLRTFRAYTLVSNTEDVWNYEWYLVVSYRPKMT
ncbi:hypothetical protein JHW43_008219 [Diplocarpon mali]|nr:hypothetical protein JHW43_008219 [Diplocarpon mali]